VSGRVLFASIGTRAGVLTAVVACDERLGAFQGKPGLSLTAWSMLEELQGDAESSPLSLSSEEDHGWRVRHGRPRQCFRQSEL